MPAFRIAAWPAHPGLHLYPLLYLDPEWLGAVPVSFYPLPFLVATETWSSAELRGRPGAASEHWCSPHSASRTIPASSALDYQVPAKAPKVSSVPFFSTRWWQAARHLRSLKTLLLKIGKARKTWSSPPYHTFTVQSSLHFYVGEHLLTMVTIQPINSSDTT